MNDLNNPWHRVSIGENVPEMFSADLGLEMTNQSCLKIAINVCEDKNDYVTRDIFLKILDDTEEHTSALVSPYLAGHAPQLVIYQ